MKLTTPIDIKPLPVQLHLNDSIFVLGSCFADNIGDRLNRCGFDACVNPTGTLYNPASIAAAVERLDSGKPFTEADCVEMGAGAGLVCSFSHHSSFARPTAEEFLADANCSLSEACGRWKSANKVIITLGTAFVWRLAGGEVVTNCLKRPAREFTRGMLSVDAISGIIAGIVRSHPDKEFILTVSPIRHLGDGAHANTLSKASLHLGLQEALSEGNACYFDAFEILLDELRDYRFFAEDLVHPSPTAVGCIWEKFVEAAVCPADRALMGENEKAWRQMQHRPFHIA